MLADRASHVSASDAAGRLPPPLVATLETVDTAAAANAANAAANAAATKDASSAGSEASPSAAASTSVAAAAAAAAAAAEARPQRSNRRAHASAASARAAVWAAAEASEEAAEEAAQEAASAEGEGGGEGDGAAEAEQAEQAWRLADAPYAWAAARLHCLWAASLHRLSSAGRCTWEHLDHTADVQLHAWGTRLEEAFAQCALAMFALMTELETVGVWLPPPPPPPPAATPLSTPVDAVRVRAASLHSCSCEQARARRDGGVSESSVSSRLEVWAGVGLPAAPPVEVCAQGHDLHSLLFHFLDECALLAPRGARG